MFCCVHNVSHEAQGTHISRLDVPKETTLSPVKGTGVSWCARSIRGIQFSFLVSGQHLVKRDKSWTKWEFLEEGTLHWGALLCCYVVNSRNAPRSAQRYLSHALVLMWMCWRQRFRISVRLDFCDGALFSDYHLFVLIRALGETWKGAECDGLRACKGSWSWRAGRVKSRKIVLDSEASLREFLLIK